MNRCVSSADALLATYDIYQENNKLIRELISEPLLEKSEFGVISVASIIVKIVNGLVGIYKKIKEKFKSLFKIFSARAKDVYLDNDKFLSKYGSKLNRISYAEVSFDKGYSMDINKVNKANEIGMLTSSTFSDLKMIIMSNKKVFDDTKDINYYVTKNRAAILGGGDYITNTNDIQDSIFKSELNNKYYGTRGRLLYTVSDAMNVIKNYKSMVSTASNMKNMSENMANKEIKELEQIKKLVSDKAATKKFARTREAANSMVNQLTKLSQYRTKTLSDSIIAYQVILQYIDDINLLAKSVCIKALREN